MKESELVSRIENLHNEMLPLFEDHAERGMFVMAIDNTLEDNKTAMAGSILGTKQELVIGLSNLMKKSDEVREVLMDAVDFYKFEKNPARQLLGTLHGLLDEIEEDIKKRKASKDKEEPVPAEEVDN